MTNKVKQKLNSRHNVSNPTINNITVPSMKTAQIGDDDAFRFNDASTHEGHLRQNGKLIWFCNETAIKISHIDSSDWTLSFLFL